MADLGLVIRAGGSGLFVVIGMAAILFARRNKGAIALGVVLASAGVRLVGVNLVREAALAEELWTPISAVLIAVQVVAYLGLLSWWPRPIRSAERWILWIAGAVWMAVSSLVFFQQIPPSLEFMEAGRPIPSPYPAVVIADYVLLSFGMGFSAVAATVFPLRYLASAPEESALRRQLPVYTFVLLGIETGGDLLQSGFFLGQGIPLFPYLVLPWLASGFLWLYATRREDSRPALVASLGVFVILGVGLAMEALAPASSHTRGGDLQNVAVGVYRTLTAFLVAVGMLRLRFLGYQPRVRTVRRGTLAMGALAVLFIVAQVGQNFLSAEYGLLTGGIIAGTFLFAASPVQRAFERMGEKRPQIGRVPSAQVRAGRDQEAAYRDAVRLACKDRRFEPAEEIALANLADRLGLTAMRAIEIRLAVETERGLR